MDYPALELHMRDAHNVVDSELVAAAVVPPKRKYLVKFVCGSCNSAKQRLWLAEKDALDHIDQQHSPYFCKYMRAACRLCGVMDTVEAFRGHDSNCLVLAKLAMTKDLHSAESQLAPDLLRRNWEGNLSRSPRRSIPKICEKSPSRLNVPLKRYAPLRCSGSGSLKRHAKSPRRSQSPRKSSTSVPLSGGRSRSPLTYDKNKNRHITQRAEILNPILKFNDDIRRKYKSKSSRPLPYPGSSSEQQQLMIRSTREEENKKGKAHEMYKWREHRWKFKSSEPFPDPRWSPEQQLMIGPIPGDMRPRDIESALVFHGPIHWIFIQDNHVWLKKNKERFMKEGKMHRFVKFGYIV